MHVYVIAAVLIAAGVWDLYAIRRWGLQSGKTISWMLYTDSRTWPVLGFFAGYGVRWAVPGHVIPMALAFVAGHIFATMRGAK